MSGIFRLEMIPSAVTVVFLLWFFRYYIKASAPLAGTTEWIERKLEKPRLGFVRHPMERKDIRPLIIIVVVFSVIAFFLLQPLFTTGFSILSLISWQSNSPFPPLGTLATLFMMTPILMGLGFGIVMLVVLYTFIKNLFGKTPIAVCGTILVGPVFMQLQVYAPMLNNLAALFVLLSYYFMYRFITADPEARFRHSLVPLALSGTFFGIGVASSWTVIPSGVGLLAIYIIRMHLLSRADIYDLRKYPRKTILYFVLFFVAVPVIIYWLSYIPYGIYYVSTVREGLLWNSDFYRLIRDNQLSILGQRQLAAEFYSPVSWRWGFGFSPVIHSWFFSSWRTTNLILWSSWNPLVWWGGFMAIIAMAVRTARFRDGAALFILIGYASQFLQWVRLPLVFTYVNLPGAVFSILALAAVFNVIYERGKNRGKKTVYIYTALFAALLLIVYISEIVLRRFWLPEFFNNFLRWII